MSAGSRYLMSIITVRMSWRACLATCDTFAMNASTRRNSGASRVGLVTAAAVKSRSSSASELNACVLPSDSGRYCNRVQL